MTLEKRTICAFAALASVLVPASAGYTARADSNARSYKGEKTLAFRGGYAGYNKSATAGLEFTYRFSRLFRLAPSVDYVIRRHDTDALVFEVDAQFLVPFSGDRMAFYPYVGPKYASWNYHPGRDSNDVSTRRSRLGLDAGVGVEANISPTFRVGVSGGYTFMKYFHGFDAALTLSYRF